MNNNLLASINWTTFGIVMAIIAVLSILFAILIVLVSKLCAVKEDERISAVSEKLAGANCGGCGFAGCADFAKALAEGKADLTMCGPTPNENKAEIAVILDIPYSEQEAVYAVVKCAGGVNAGLKFDYIGNEGCTAQNTYMGGSKLCPQGCLGGGSCIINCTKGAMKIKDGVCTVNKAICEACGVCAKKCPKNLIDFIPKTAKVYVACSTTCKGKDAMTNCKVSCIGCGLCAKNCPNQAIEMINNLPVINYSKCTGCKVCVSKCPRKSIKEI